MVDLNKSTEANQNNPQLELVNSGTKTKAELVEGLSENQLECPYPNHEGYLKVRNTITPDQQKEMKENIRITADGKVEIIKMKKKFSMLTAQHNGTDIFDGSYTDKNGNTGIKGVIYLTDKAAEKESKNQGKKLLKDKSEVEQFIEFIPGENTKEKILNLVKLFSLEKTGYWNNFLEKWGHVGSVGYVTLSGTSGTDSAYALKWDSDNDNASIGRSNRVIPHPSLSCEPLD